MLYGGDFRPNIGRNGCLGMLRSTARVQVMLRDLERLISINGNNGLRSVSTGIQRGGRGVFYKYIPLNRDCPPTRRPH